VIEVHAAYNPLRRQKSGQRAKHVCRLGALLTDVYFCDRRGRQLHHAKRQRVGDRFAALRAFGLGISLHHELDESDGRASLQAAFGSNLQFPISG